MSRSLPFSSASGDSRDRRLSGQALSLERVETDPEFDGCQDIFAVKFQVDGPNANAEIEITVSDHKDEAHVISVAQHTLHVAMTMWGRVTSDRFIRARAADLPKRGASRRR